MEVPPATADLTSGRLVKFPAADAGGAIILPRAGVTTSRRQGGLKTRTLRELLAHPFPTRQPLLFPVLRQGESMMLWAQTGAGKTWVSLSMALAIAGGGSFLGWTAETPRRVMLLDGEMAMEDLQDRLRDLCAAIDGFDPEAAADNLLIVARQDQGADTVFPDLANPDGQARILEMVRQHGAELLVADNFSTLAEVEDENAAGAMNPVLAFLLRLKQARVACILVHHSGKTGQSYRGSSKLAATFEVILGLTRDEAAGGVQGAAFTTFWEKFRGEPHDTLVPRDVRLGRSEAGALAWDAQPAERDNIRLFLEAAATGNFPHQTAAGASLGWDKTKTSKTVTKAIAAGRTTRRQLDEIFEAAREGCAVEVAESGEPPF
ncbi:AAA family ATPase [Roseomonas sp. NAR14]|uniref:AAA family ATPase n=1 Tax=Roseomonas acroporae TaxID=2937791 RepID=A0A9X1YEQ5_9PROT|nr:AAA family ATPase [Roseomonas acroporae]MCK8787322.1 AAA family ATPase [Roseomonas acroporae]